MVELILAPASRDHLHRAQSLLGPVLSGFPDRHAHCLGVARRLVELLAVEGGLARGAEVLGLLHDVGYGVPDTGMHALDGARWMGAHGFSAWAPAVAWHSTAQWEYAALGMDLASLRAEFPQPRNRLAGALWLADFTTSATGEPTTLVERLEGIRSRYDSGPVLDALDASLPELDHWAKVFGIPGPR